MSDSIGVSKVCKYILLLKLKHELLEMNFSYKVKKLSLVIEVWDSMLHHFWLIISISNSVGILVNNDTTSR